MIGVVAEPMMAMRKGINWAREVSQDDLTVSLEMFGRSLEALLKRTEPASICARVGLGRRRMMMEKGESAVRVKRQLMLMSPQEYGGGETKIGS